MTITDDMRRVHYTDIHVMHIIYLQNFTWLAPIAASMRQTGKYIFHAGYKFSFIL
jgi:hypothetical protein